MTEPYQPKPGDRVLLTVRAIVGPTGQRFLVHDDACRLIADLTEGHSAIVTIEPAPVELPTGLGARIRATVEDGRRRLVFVRTPEGFADPAPWVFRNPDDGRLNRRNGAGLSNVEILDAGEPS